MLALLAAALTLIISGCVFFWRGEYPDHTVDSVDLSRYMGRWYEIASFPNWFQKGCLCTTADYALADGHVTVINSCRRGSPLGKLDVATGKAYVVPDTNNAQLRVQFQWPFKGDYWVIALDENYQYAMVGHPQKKYLWILSRSPIMDDATYARLVGIAAAKGYDVSRLQKTDQTCSAPSDGG